MEIGDDIIDSDGYCCRVTNITATSIELFQLKRTNRGINHRQWYSLDKFFKDRFKCGLEGYLAFINKASYEQIKTYFRTKKLMDQHIW